MRCLVVVVCVVSQGIIQSRLRVNPVTGDNVASWRGVLFRHLKIQGNDRLAEAASKIHKCVVYGVSSVGLVAGVHLFAVLPVRRCLHDDTLLSGSRATWLSVIARYFAVVASLDVAKTRNPLATLPAPAGNPPKTESEDSASAWCAAQSVTLPAATAHTFGRDQARSANDHAPTMGTQARVVRRGRDTAKTRTHPGLPGPPRNRPRKPSRKALGRLTKPSRRRGSALGS